MLVLICSHVQVTLGISSQGEKRNFTTKKQGTEGQGREEKFAYQYQVPPKNFMGKITGTNDLLGVSHYSAIGDTISCDAPIAR